MSTKKQIRSLLSELDQNFVEKDKELILESRASNLIQGAINLISFIKENYSADVADELERRFINSIRGQDINKFTRGVRRIKEEKKS